MKPRGERGGLVTVDLPSYVGIRTSSAHAQPIYWDPWCDCGWQGDRCWGHGEMGAKREAKLTALRHSLLDHSGELELPRTSSTRPRPSIKAG